MNNRTLAAFLAIPLLFASTSPLPAQDSRPGVALVLSGGGARGGAHVGVLKVLEEEQIPIDLIVGTSFGALVGALYSVGYSADDLELILEQVDWDELLDDTPDRRLLNLENKRRTDRQMFRLAFEDFELQLPTGLQAGQKIRQLLDRLTAFPVYEVEEDFDRLPIRYRAVATDILTGEAHVFSGGPIGRAVRASIAVPGLFTPLELGEKLLLDGGLADNLPVDVARELDARVVIAVDVSTPLRKSKEEFRSILDVLDQAVSIHIEEHKERNLGLTDVLVSPDLEGFTSSDFARIGEMIPKGEEAARRRMTAIDSELQAVGIQRAGASRQPRLERATFDLTRYQVSNRILRPQRVDTEGLEQYPELERQVRRNASAITLERIDRRVSRLYGTSRFDTVNYRLKKEQGDPVLEFQAEQSPSSELGLGIRYDRDFNFTGAVDLISRNLGGARNDLAFQALVGNVKLARLELANRSLTGGRVVFWPSVYARSFERRLFSGSTEIGDFDDRRAGVRVAAGGLLGNFGRLEVGYHFDRVDLAGVGGDRRQAGPESLAGIEAAFDLDTLDDSVFPRAGSRAHVSVDAQASALGGDFSFRRYFAEGRRYFPLSSDATLGVRGRWGLAQGDVPLYEEFFSGGAHYFPFAATPFIGLDRGQRRSRQLLNLGLEYRRTLKRFQLGFVQRVDWGARYDTGIFSQEDRLLQFQELLHGFGGGLYLETRFLGPILVEAGGTSEGDFNAYVSIGHFF